MDIKINEYIDHTNLKPDATKMAIEQLCGEALEHNFKAVCVSPYFVKHAFEKLKHSDVKVATVIGFPMGYSCAAAKVEEVKRALNDGAHELDVVVNIQAIKAGDYNYIKNELESICTYTHIKNHIVKVIIEIGLLSQQEIINTCKVCEEVGVDFVKTSTGVIGRGVTTADIILLKKILPAKIKVKASGGIKTLEQVKDLIEAGADRIGASASVSFVNQIEE
jgi:deoxyribose-phosphate aldolase